MILERFGVSVEGIHYLADFEICDLLKDQGLCLRVNQKKTLLDYVTVPAPCVGKQGSGLEISVVGSDFSVAAGDQSVC
jgi:hypothetical protein